MALAITATPSAGPYPGTLSQRATARPPKTSEPGKNRTTAILAASAGVVIDLFSRRGAIQASSSWMPT